MRRRWVAVVLGLALAGVAPSVQADPGPPAGRHGITLLGDRVISADGRLHELTLASAVRPLRTTVRLLLPTGYDDPANATRRYPVLLLLHGAGLDEAAWTDNSHVEEHTADQDVIVVMPDGGVLGFYSDWFDGPQWETYHLDELLPWVESTYRAVGTREGRAVAGLSMGGFGAMSYAAQHPDRFVAAASFSGAVDLTGLDAVEMAALDTVIAPDPLWGSFVTHEARWRSHNPPDVAGNLHGVAVRLDVGSGLPCPGEDPSSGVVEALMFLMNVSFDYQLTAAGVPHEYRPRPCGTHSWLDWDAELGDWLPVLMDTFAAPPPPPVSFDYRTARRAWSVWGWSFATHRPALELLDLDDVSASGLTATGSGPLTVVTPPSYRPGATYAVTAARADVTTLPVGRVPVLDRTPAPGPPSTEVVTADAEGRLRFTVDLGPGHTFNQFSPGGRLAEVLALGHDFHRATVTIIPGPVGG